MPFIQKQNPFKFSALVISLTCLFLAAHGQAQEPVSNTGTTDTYRIGGFIGATDRGDQDFSYGAEFEYLPAYNRQWSYSAIIEHTPDVVRNQDATLLLATANFRPQDNMRLKLIGGTGIEFRSYASDGVRFRVGAGYDLVMEEKWTVTPSVAFDFGEGEDSVLMRATAYYRF